MLTTLPLFGAIPGGPEMLIILLVLVLLFGANKIPKLARSTGQAMGEFKKGREEVEDELQAMQGDEEDDEEFAADSTDTTDESAESAETVETDTEKN
ncbi:Sec-independent protein translocase subunit TatA/TatB [Halobaculum lipolyticum]|uniref:Sec-independent protein translocase protein TatA n=1 Tax=Halobaculum lipolyticum TaxID=3032001 RepID=A0ABD5W5E0_9EURY|nr:twin-arginine translocase TatA/TatE family subunit [Halobaculum sp. DT31]